MKKDESELIIGCLNFGTVTNSLEVCQIVAEAKNLKIKDFEVAAIYGEGKSKEYLSEAIKATKFSEAEVSIKIGLDSYRDTNSRFMIRKEFLNGNSILTYFNDYQKLFNERITSIQLHAFNNENDWASIYGAIQNLLSKKSITGWGVSNHKKEEFLFHCNYEMMPNILQVQFNIFEQKALAEFVEVLSNKNLEIWINRSLARGLITSRVLGGLDIGSSVRASNSQRVKDHFHFLEPFMAPVRKQLTEMAENLGVRVEHLALKFNAEISNNSKPIIGPRSAAQLIDLVIGYRKIAHLKVSQRINDILEEAKIMEKVVNYPQSFLEQ
jgi:aryl-alcohol dehydrogenase-like predicted oxidoreductase